MDKKYLEPIISLQLYDEADIITASGVTPTSDGFTRDLYEESGWRLGA